MPDGDSVLVVQTGRYGEYLGEIDVDLDNMTADYRLIPVDSRLDNRLGCTPGFGHSSVSPRSGFALCP